jgi:hypothetical protein
MSSPATVVFDGKPTAKNLKMIGNSWHVSILHMNNTLVVGDEAKQYINKILLEVCGFRVYTVWQKNDPFVKPKDGRGKSYITLMRSANSQADKGQAWAKYFLSWMDGSLAFSELPDDMKDLAVITHVAEVGRGYGQTCLDGLYNFLVDVVRGNRTWLQLKDNYEAAKTYSEDTEYVPDGGK